MALKKLGLRLDTVTERAIRLKQIRKSGLKIGDLVIVETLNSIYKIIVIGSDYYHVSGGWFVRKGECHFRC